ncbi:MAG: PD-(D/E)XK nuclease family protein, partial [Planctomycetota bacterium]
SVPSFREYIKCPYRFYLSKILRLENSLDDWQEMDGRLFGNLAHEVLEEFGRCDVRDETELKKIREFLNDELTTRAESSFQGSHLPAVKIQVEQLRMRMDRFAELQAERAQSGWRIASVEENNKHSLMIDDQEFRISGTIDRVDIHSQSGQVEIWDYKTSDMGDGPRSVHLNRDGWKDLQLPLYRHLVKEIDVLKGADLKNATLGYVLLPRRLDKIRFEYLQCSDGELAAADDLVKTIVRSMRKKLYWPPKRQPPKFSEAFAGICQDSVFERFEFEPTAGSVEK